MYNRLWAGTSAETSVPLDVCKFLALRPAEPADERKTAISIIRDGRSDFEEGRRALAQSAPLIHGQDPERIKTRERDLKMLAALTSDARSNWTAQLL